MTIDIGADALGRWQQTEGGAATLINLSENHTFRIEGPNGARHVLRVHRPGYQTRESIESELAWLGALRRDTGMPIPQPLPGRDGSFLQRISVTGETDPRFAVLFAFEEGREPLPGENLTSLFATLGRFAAIAHGHVESWQRPAGFTRQVWTAGAILDAEGLWGNWRTSPHVQGATLATLTALDARLRQDLGAYGNGANRFGLIHADMRLANLLVDGDRLTLIDFDDSGFCWFMYDFGAAVSFFEDDPRVPALKQAWIDAYRIVRPLSVEDIAAIDTMVMLRRMALLAWIGSHGETDLAKSHAGDFAVRTAKLAEAYLG